MGHFSQPAGSGSHWLRWERRQGIGQPVTREGPRAGGHQLLPLGSQQCRASLCILPAWEGPTVRNLGHMGISTPGWAPMWDAGLRPHPALFKQALRVQTRPEELWQE